MNFSDFCTKWNSLESIIKQIHECLTEWNKKPGLREVDKKELKQLNYLGNDMLNHLVQVAEFCHKHINSLQQSGIGDEEKNKYMPLEDLLPNLLEDINTFCRVIRDPNYSKGEEFSREISGRIEILESIVLHLSNDMGKLQSKQTSKTVGGGCPKEGEDTTAEEAVDPTPAEVFPSPAAAPKGAGAAMGGSIDDLPFVGQVEHNLVRRGIGFDATRVVAPISPDSVATTRDESVVPRKNKLTKFHELHQEINNFLLKSVRVSINKLTREQFDELIGLLPGAHEEAEKMQLKAMLTGQLVDLSRELLDKYIKNIQEAIKLAQKESAGEEEAGKKAKKKAPPQVLINAQKIINDLLAPKQTPLEILIAKINNSELGDDKKTELRDLIQNSDLSKDEGFFNFSPEVRNLYDKYETDINKDEYKKLVLYCRLAHNFENNGDPLEHAVKLAVVFGTADNAIKALNNFGNQTKKGGGYERDGQFVHQACLFTLPDNRPADDNIWKKWRAVLQENFNNAEYRIVFTNIDVVQEFYQSSRLTDDEALNQKNSESFIDDFLKKYEKSISKSDSEKIEELKQSTESNKDILILKEVIQILRAYINKEKSQYVAAGQGDERNRNLVDARTNLQRALSFYTAKHKALNIPFADLDKDTYSAVYALNLQSSSEVFKLLSRHGLSGGSKALFYSLDRSEAGKNIPDVGILELEEHPGYYMRKLDVINNEYDAAVAACLGRITYCCQSIGDYGTKAAEHGLTSPHGGFYVLCKKLSKDAEPNITKDKVVAQSWAWRSIDDGLVFDSVEGNPQVRERQAVVDFYNAISKKLSEEHSINEITVGNTNTGGVVEIGRDDFHGLHPLLRIVAQGTPRDEIGYRGDSRDQKVLLYNTRKELLIESKNFSNEDLQKLINNIVANELRRIATISDFLVFMRFIDEGRKTAVCDFFKDKIGSDIKINSVIYLVDTLRHLNPEQITAVCNSLKDKICSDLKINSVYRLADVISELNPEQKKAVYDSLKDKICSNMINCVDELTYTLYRLNPEQITAFCNSLKDKIGSDLKINSLYKLEKAIRGLNLEQKKAVYGSLKDKICSNMINCVNGLAYTLYYLNPEQITAVYDSLKNKIGSDIKINNGREFGAVLKYLNLEQITAVCNSLKDKIGSEIKINNGSEFGVVLYHLNPKQITAVCDSLKDKIGSEIKINNGREFGAVLQHLNPEQITAVCDSLKDKIGSDIKINNGSEFGAVLQYLNPEQRVAVCAVVRVSDDAPTIPSTHTLGPGLSRPTIEDGASVNSAVTTGGTADGVAPREATTTTESTPTRGTTSAAVDSSTVVGRGRRGAPRPPIPGLIGPSRTAVNACVLEAQDLCNKSKYNEAVQKLNGFENTYKCARTTPYAKYHINMWRAVALSKLERFEDAAATYSAIINCVGVFDKLEGHERALVLEYRSMIYWKLGDINKAIEDLTKIIETNGILNEDDIEKKIGFLNRKIDCRKSRGDSELADDIALLEALEREKGERKHTTTAGRP